MTTWIRRPTVRSLITTFVATTIMIGGPGWVRAQAVDIEVEPQTPAPGADVTVSITDAPPGDRVIVQLGTNEETATVGGEGSATVTISAPDVVGEAIGRVRVGVADFPFTITVVNPDQTTTSVGTTTTVATTTTTTTTVPVTPPPVTGIDDADTIAAIGGALVAVGIAVTVAARRPAPAGLRSSTEIYRLPRHRRPRGTGRS